MTYNTANPSCADCGTAPDIYGVVVARRLFLVNTGVGNRVIEGYYCNPCTEARASHQDTNELCIACHFEKPNHGLHCPAGPKPGRLD